MWFAAETIKFRFRIHEWPNSAGTRYLLLVWDGLIDAAMSEAYCGASSHCPGASLSARLGYRAFA
jgi:hypothetical protein